MKTVRIPKGGLPRVEPQAEGPDSPGFARARVVLGVVAGLVYLALAANMLRGGVRPVVLVQMAIGFLGFFLVLLPRIRPGTRTFWMCFAGVLYVFALPAWFAGADRPVRLGLLATYPIAALLLIWRSRHAFREETTGWRLIFIGGIAFGAMNVIMWLWQ